MKVLRGIFIWYCRLPDSVVHANRTGDSQVFYQQAAPPVAGIPMPSDLMGVVPLKAKRRLERDHGLLLLWCKIACLSFSIWSATFDVLLFN